MSRYYDWQQTMSRQTGTNGEHCIVIGGKDIGKTFGLRLKCIDRFIKARERFCEVCRTNAERDEVAPGYFDKIQSEGFYRDKVFKVEKNCGYIADAPIGDEKPEWELLCYFVALTNFQREKKRTFVQPKRFIFDEAVIDSKDRHHRYLPDEFLIFANLLDSISRQQPGDAYNYYVYYLANAVDFSCPYLYNLGVVSVPKFGYTWYRDKTVLVHYVEPWDADDRKAYTLVGLMLAGHEESRVIFDNEFSDETGGEIMKKTPNAQYRWAFKWGRMVFAIWIDRKRALWFVTSKLPKGAGNVYTLAKRDSSVNMAVIGRSEPLAKLVVEVYKVGGLRYESAHIREAFFEVLSFMGVQ